ncbi:MAG: hypothetical protein AAGC68_10305 [Verrucomicrobiota bacterium]
MEKFKQWSQVFETMPVPAQIFVGCFLLAFSAASIYSRINLNLGAKTFPGIHPDVLRKDWRHILVYSGVPTLLFLGFVALLLTYHFG